MKLNIGLLKSEFESELNTQNWFKSVGKHSLDADKIFAPFCVKFAKFEQLSELLKSNEWSDIDLDIFAEICRLSDQILLQYSLTDELAATAREILSTKKRAIDSRYSDMRLAERNLRLFGASDCFACISRVRYT